MDDTMNGATGLSTFRFKRPLVLALVASLTLSACTTTGGRSGASGTAAADDYCNPNNPKLTPAEKQMCEDAAGTFNETVAGGALTGALAGVAIGALAGLLRGGRSAGSDLLIGAAVGGIVGGIMGGVDGYITAKAQETGNNQAMMLNSMANDVDQQNVKLKKLVSSSAKVLDDSQKRIAKLNDDQRAGHASLAQVQEERQRIEGHRDRLTAWLGKAKDQRDQYVQASAKMRRDGGSTADIDAKINGMNTQIAELEKNVAGLNTATQIRRA